MKEYIAFISYKSENKSAARDIYNFFRAFVFPDAFRGREDIPDRIKPVFLDDEEINGHRLEEILEQALDHSSWLIVLCSKELAHNPRWIDREIRHYIQRGNENRIIPLILNGVVHSKDDECYPPSLLELGDNEIIAFNPQKYEGGKIEAFYRIVEKMFGFQNKDLWDKYRIRVDAINVYNIARSDSLKGNNLLGAKKIIDELKTHHKDLDRDILGKLKQLLRDLLSHYSSPEELFPLRNIDLPLGGNISWIAPFPSGNYLLLLEEESDESGTFYHYVVYNTTNWDVVEGLDLDANALDDSVFPVSGDAVVQVTNSAINVYKISGNIVTDNTELGDELFDDLWSTNFSLEISLFNNELLIITNHSELYYCDLINRSVRKGLEADYVYLSSDKNSVIVFNNGYHSLLLSSNSVDALLSVPIVKRKAPVTDLKTSVSEKGDIILYRDNFLKIYRAEQLEWSNRMLTEHEIRGAFFFHNGDAVIDFDTDLLLISGDNTIKGRIRKRPIRLPIVPYRDGTILTHFGSSLYICSIEPYRYGLVPTPSSRIDIGRKLAGYWLKEELLSLANSHIAHLWIRHDNDGYNEHPHILVDLISNYSRETRLWNVEYSEKTKCKINSTRNLVYLEQRKGGCVNLQICEWERARKVKNSYDLILNPEEEVVDVMRNTTSEGSYWVMTNMNDNVIIYSLTADGDLSKEHTIQFTSQAPAKGTICFLNSPDIILVNDAIYRINIEKGLFQQSLMDYPNHILEAPEVNIVPSLSAIVASYLLSSPFGDKRMVYCWDIDDGVLVYKNENVDLCETEMEKVPIPHLRGDCVLFGHSLFMDFPAEIKLKRKAKQLLKTCGQ